MALPVDVTSIDVLRGVREALVLFGDDAKGALIAMDAEIRQCVHWLQHEQRIHWQAQVKRQAERLSQAKTELHRKQLSQMFGQHAHDSEQRDAVREAKRALEEAEEKLEKVRSWLPVLEQAVMEYDGQARPFGDVLEFDLGNSVSMMDRMIDALEEYARLDAPRTRPAAAPVETTTDAPVIDDPASVEEQEEE